MRSKDDYVATPQFSSPPDAVPSDALAGDDCPARTAAIGKIEPVADTFDCKVLSRDVEDIRVRRLDKIHVIRLRRYTESSFLQSKRTGPVGIRNAPLLFRP